MKRCLECFGEHDDNVNVCPLCGSVTDIRPAEPIHLAPGTILSGRYILGRAIGSGGFGIVYKAWDSKLETVVAVKEFFVSRLVTRAVGLKNLIVTQKSQIEFDYRKDRFLAEARTMAKFGNHRSIPNVFEFFEENNTAYIVMELMAGSALSDYQKQVSGNLDIDFSIMIANEVGNALKSLHEQGIIHRDVAPDNIFICSGKEIKIKLMDLGAAKLEDSTDDVIDIILKPGYSPTEQYEKSKNIGTWTDIYALGATLYTLLTGVKPDESTNRKIDDTVIPPAQLNQAVSENLSNAVMKAMAVDRHMRFKNVDEFLSAINGERRVIPLSKEKRRKSLKRVIGITTALAVVTAGAVFGAKLLDKKVEEESLAPADISIWFAVEDGSDEEAAMQAVKSDFEEAFPDVTIELKAIPSDEYEDEINKCVEDGNIPTLFESTGLSDEILENCTDLDNVVNTEQFKNCLFIDKADCTKQIPLAIEVPVAFIITKGAESVDYEEKYFSELSDFNYNNIAVDWRYLNMIINNFPDSHFTASAKDFLDNEENKSAVMLSSTMVINEFRETLTNYEKNYVFPDKDEIICKYTYQWSIGQGEDDEIRAAEKLLSWMLGNVYQSDLMISRCNDGQIPVNEICFKSKIESRILSPISEIYDKFVFEGEDNNNG